MPGATEAVEEQEEKRVELISDSILELSAPWLVRNSGSEMRNEAISLALLLVVAVMVPIGQGAVDIFSVSSR